MDSKQNRRAERDYARDAKTLEPAAFRRLSAESVRLLEHAQSEARACDDNHVGTEHIVLGIYALGTGSAARALEAAGITRDVFVAQLEDEPGPSPLGTIPLTPRARMIVALAGLEASQAGSDKIEPAHILLGVIRESQRWEETGTPGPHHLRAAASIAQTTLSALEQTVRSEMGRGESSSR